MAIFKARLPGLYNPSLFQPIEFFGKYDFKTLRPDLLAGLTVAVVLLPQAVAFSLIVNLPPVMGIYAAIVAGITGSLWGCSHQLNTGPTNAMSILVLSALMNLPSPQASDPVVTAGLLAVLAGLFQMLLGVARLGVLVNFVSHSVVVGFASGAGVLIVVRQLGNALGVRLPGGNVLETLAAIPGQLSNIHGPTAVLSIVAAVIMVGVARLRPSLPGAFLAMIAAGIGVLLFNLNQLGVAVVGRLPTGLPPLANLSLPSLSTISDLSLGAVAVGAIGLVESTAIGRTIATQTGQRLDSNQEFLGQGLANLGAGFFSGFPVAGSFSRSAVNFKAGAQTRMSSLLASLLVLGALFVVAPAGQYLPLAALAAVLIVTGIGMIDYAEIIRILKGTRGDAGILVATFLGTLFSHIEYAVLGGILLSFGIYILKTSLPRVEPVLPDSNFRHFINRPGLPECPQLGVLEIHGDLYFGAVHHIEEEIHRQHERNPEQRLLLLRMKGVHHCDFSGIHALESIVRFYREMGGDVFITRVSRPILRVMVSTGFQKILGRDRFLLGDNAIRYLFHRVLDPAVCIYECPVRVFRECQNLPKQLVDFRPEHLGPLRPADAPTVSPEELWKRMHTETPPLLVDVREPREFQQAHIPGATLIPLPRILSGSFEIPKGIPLVLVCRGGRRSQRAAEALRHHGYDQICLLKGGMLGWEACNLLEAVDLRAGKGSVDQTSPS